MVESETVTLKRPHSVVQPIMQNVASTEEVKEGVILDRNGFLPNSIVRGRMLDRRASLMNKIALVWAKESGASGDESKSGPRPSTVDVEIDSKPPGVQRIIEHQVFRRMLIKCAYLNMAQLLAILTEQRFRRNMDVYMMTHQVAEVREIPALLGLDSYTYLERVMDVCYLPDMYDQVLAVVEEMYKDKEALLHIQKAIEKSQPKPKKKKRAKQLPHVKVNRQTISRPQSLAIESMKMQVQKHRTFREVKEQLQLSADDLLASLLSDAFKKAFGHHLKQPVDKLVESDVKQILDIMTKPSDVKDISALVKQMHSASLRTPTARAAANQYEKRRESDRKLAEVTKTFMQDKSKIDLTRASFQLRNLLQNERRGSRAAMLATLQKQIDELLDYKQNRPKTGGPRAKTSSKPGRDADYFAAEGRLITSALHMLDGRLISISELAEMLVNLPEVLRQLELCMTVDGNETKSESLPRPRLESLEKDGKTASSLEKIPTGVTQDVKFRAPALTAISLKNVKLVRNKLPSVDSMDLPFRPKRKRIVKRFYEPVKLPTATIPKPRTRHPPMVDVDGGKLRRSILLAALPADLKAKLIDLGFLDIFGEASFWYFIDRSKFTDEEIAMLKQTELVAIQKQRLELAMLVAKHAGISLEASEGLPPLAPKPIEKKRPRAKPPSDSRAEETPSSAISTLPNFSGMEKTWNTVFEKGLSDAKKPFTMDVTSVDDWKRLNVELNQLLEGQDASTYRTSFVDNMFDLREILRYRPLDLVASIVTTVNQLRNPDTNPTERGMTNKFLMQFVSAILAENEGEDLSEKRIVSLTLKKLNWMRARLLDLDFMKKEPPKRMQRVSNTRLEFMLTRLKMDPSYNLTIETHHQKLIGILFSTLIKYVNLSKILTGDEMERLIGRLTQDLLTESLKPIEINKDDLPQIFDGDPFRLVVDQFWTDLLTEGLNNGLLGTQLVQLKLVTMRMFSFLKENYPLLPVLKEQADYQMREGEMLDEQNLRQLVQAHLDIDEMANAMLNKVLEVIGLPAGFKRQEAKLSQAKFFAENVVTIGAQLRQRMPDEWYQKVHRQIPLAYASLVTKGQLVTLETIRSTCELYEFNQTLSPMEEWNETLVDFGLLVACSGLVTGNSLDYLLDLRGKLMRAFYKRMPQSESDDIKENVAVMWNEKLDMQLLRAVDLLLGRAPEKSSWNVKRKLRMLRRMSQLRTAYPYMLQILTFSEHAFAKKFDELKRSNARASWKVHAMHRNSKLFIHVLKHLYQFTEADLNRLEVQFSIELPDGLKPPHIVSFFQGQEDFQKEKLYRRTLVEFLRMNLATHGESETRIRTILDEFDDLMLWYPIIFQPLDVLQVPVLPSLTRTPYEEVLGCVVDTMEFLDLITTEQNVYIYSRLYNVTLQYSITQQAHTTQLNDADLPSTIFRHDRHRQHMVDYTDVLKKALLGKKPRKERGRIWSLAVGICARIPQVFAGLINNRETDKAVVPKQERRLVNLNFLGSMVNMPTGSHEMRDRAVRILSVVILAFMGELFDYEAYERVRKHLANSMRIPFAQQYSCQPTSIVANDPFFLMETVLVNRLNAFVKMHSNEFDFATKTNMLYLIETISQRNNFENGVQFNMQFLVLNCSTKPRLISRQDGTTVQMYSVNYPVPKRFYEAEKPVKSMEQFVYMMKAHRGAVLDCMFDWCKGLPFVPGTLHPQKYRVLCNVS